MTVRHGPICHEWGIRGYGEPEYGVCIVGIAPGADEMRLSKRPFTGASGKLLDDLLRFSGWSRDKTYTTNTICWQNNHPTEDEIEGCGLRFRHELDDLKPKLIITAGEIANATVMGAKRRKGSRGSVVWSSRWNSYILDTHHPSFALQANSMSAVQDIIRDLSKIPDILTWRPNGEDAKVIYQTLHTLDDTQALLDTLERDMRVALDIETSNPDVENIDAYNDTLLRFALSFERYGREYTYVVRDTAFPQCVLDRSHVQSYRKRGRCLDCDYPERVLNWPLDVKWTFQAGQFDIPAMYNYFGVEIPLRDDTMLMSVCTDERPGYHRLKDNAREWLGAGWYEADVKKYYNGKMHLLPAEKIDEYNALDAAYTRRLVPIFWRKMQEDDTVGVYETLLRPAIQTFIKMQIRGINVDQVRLKQLAYPSTPNGDDGWFPKYRRMYRDLQLQAYKYGWPDDQINLESNPQLAKLFYQLLSLEPLKFSKKTGNPSVDKETLDSLKHPFADGLRAYRSLDTMIGYVIAVRNHLKYDGLLHPSAFVSTTRTGRTSYHDPAMQTLPKPYTVGNDYAQLREIIIPQNPATHEIIEADYGQIEVWLAWIESKDPVLHEHLLSGDVHSATAELAFNTTRDKWSYSEWQVKRQNAKKIRFGLQYGEGAVKLSSPPPVGIGGTPQEAQVFINNYKKAYPTYTRWMYMIQERAKKQGYLRSPSGRVMRFPKVMDHKQLRQAINFPIQSTGSDYNLLSMIELYPLLLQYNSFIILNIHDSLVIESDRRYRKEVMALVRSVMEAPKFAGYPGIRVDIKVGDNLGAVKEIGEGT